MKATKVIGPIEIYQNQLLGTGSSGSVFKGKLKKPMYSPNQNYFEEIQIAVKVISHEQRSQNQVTQYLFDCEKQALIRLSHPNIIQCYGIYEDKQNTYFATEFINGGTLRDYIKQKNKITQKSAVRILKKLLHAVNYISKQGFIHRDLKPANILIKQSIDSQTGLIQLDPVIIDFGYAERVNARWKPQMFYNVGSPSYMAPQSYKQTNYNQKSDLWALGVIFFEMLTGETFDTNIKIQQLFQQPIYFIEKRISEKSFCLSTRNLKILQKILIINQNNRPDLETMAKYVSKIYQTYKIPQNNNQNSMIGSLTQRNTQPFTFANKSLLDSMRRNKVQQRFGMQSFVFNPQNNKKLVINQRKIVSRVPMNQQTSSIPFKMHQDIMKKNRSERFLTNPLLQQNKIHQSFIQQPTTNSFQFQTDLFSKKNGHILSINNREHSGDSIRKTYHSPKNLNPQVKKFSKITFNYRSPSKQFRQSYRYSQISQRS